MSYDWPLWNRYLAIVGRKSVKTVLPGGERSKSIFSGGSIVWSIIARSCSTMEGWRKHGIDIGGSRSLISTSGFVRRRRDKSGKGAEERTAHTSLRLLRLATR